MFLDGYLAPPAPYLLGSYSLPDLSASVENQGNYIVAKNQIKQDMDLQKKKKKKKKKKNTNKL